MKSAQAGAPPKGSRGNAPCGVQRRRLWWGLGQRPNCSSSNLLKENSQQRRRQRSVPAPNFALPQERPQAALSITCILSRQMGATDQHGKYSAFHAGLYIAGKTAFAGLIIPSSLSLPAPPPRPPKSSARFARIPIPPREAACKPLSASCHEKRPPARLQTVLQKNGIIPRPPR